MVRAYDIRVLSGFAFASLFVVDLTHVVFVYVDIRAWGEEGKRSGETGVNGAKNTCSLERGFESD